MRFKTDAAKLLAMKPSHPLLLAGLALFAGPALRAQQPALPLTTDGLDRLLGVIKPQPMESPWREIAWHTNVTEARQRAVAEDKPLVIFTAADGSPLGRT